MEGERDEGVLAIREENSFELIQYIQPVDDDFTYSAI